MEAGLAYEEGTGWERAVAEAAAQAGLAASAAVGASAPAGPVPGPSAAGEVLWAGELVRSSVVVVGTAAVLAAEVGMRLVGLLRASTVPCFCRLHSSLRPESLRPLGRSILFAVLYRLRLDERCHRASSNGSV